MLLLTRNGDDNDNDIMTEYDGVDNGKEGYDNDDANSDNNDTPRRFTPSCT